MSQNEENETKCMGADGSTRPVAPYARIGDDEIIFGSYPTVRVVDDDIIAKLNAAAGELPSPSYMGSWTSYCYYIENKQRDFMWYKDIELGGKRYRGVYFTSYRPNMIAADALPNNSYQDDNGYKRATVYWFEYTRIKWKIVKDLGDSAQLFCADILDAREFDAAGNKEYAKSSLKGWLEQEFVPAVFNEKESEILLATGDVGDIGLLPFGVMCIKHLNDNIKQPTEYALSQGCYCSDENKYCWLYYSGNDGPRYANRDKSTWGMSNNACDPQNTYFGIVPTVWIKLI